MRKQAIKDIFMTAATAGLSLTMLLGSHLISRRMDLGAAGAAALTPGSLERLTGLVLGLLGAVIMAWLLVGTLLALLATLSTRSGHHRLGAKIARLVPGFLARLGAAAIGGSLLLATSANAAPPPAPASQHLSGQPTGCEATPTRQGPHGDPVDSGTTAAESTILSPGWLPQRISLPLQRLLGGDTRTSQEIVVLPGDTLWSIAARHLAPEATAGDIAESWPQWHAANRELIGSDPDRLAIGTILTRPESRSTRS